MKQRPFTIIASVVLPDHLHFLWALPPDDFDFSTRWRLIKSHFSRHYLTAQAGISASRRKKGEKQIWQRRYWEHLIRDEADLVRHVEYIHFNPVKHGLAQSPGAWPYSSFSGFVREGLYPPDWGAMGKIWDGSQWME
jgi:putative transposase